MTVMTPPSSFFSRRTASAGSPCRTVVLCHWGSLSVPETTYLATPFMWSAPGASGIAGQAAAKPS
jgi:hypothetical protein